jgi:hypothetical protein
MGPSSSIRLNTLKRYSALRGLAKKLSTGQNRSSSCGLCPPAYTPGRGKSRGVARGQVRAFLYLLRRGMPESRVVAGWPVPQSAFFVPHFHFYVPIILIKFEIIFSKIKNNIVLLGL